MSKTADTSACPGCHIGCSLGNPQCTRGLEVFRPMWLRGEELPQRRGGRPPHGPRGGAASGQCGGDAERPDGGAAGRPCGEGKPGGRMPRGGPAGLGKPPMMEPEEKLTFLLTEIVPRSLADICGDDRGRLLERLVHQGGGMSLEIMPERARVDAREVEALVKSLLAEGLVEERVTECGSRFYWVTDEGRLAADRFEARRREAAVERFSALDDGERQQLEVLVEKLLAAGHQPR